MTQRIKIAASWLAFIALSATIGSSATAAVRVALMDVICEDNSYRSTMAAIDFTVALQAELSVERDFEWVERAELAKAENEFKLANFGLIDRFEAVRSGRWLKADWAVFGRISTNTANGRVVSLEIVDLQRAETLAGTNLNIATREIGPFKVDSTELRRVVLALRSLLEEVRQIHARARSKVAVAFLFLSRTRSATAQMDLEADFRRVLANGSTNGQPIHFVQLQRAGQAVDEANLVLSGLAQTDVSAWEKVADQYLWGTYKTDEIRSFDRQTRQSRADLRVHVALKLWDGKADPQVINLSLTNARSGEFAARELVAAMTPLLQRTDSRSTTRDVRRRISESLVAQAIELARSNLLSWDSSAEACHQWWEIVQVLEAACFFDPGNITARELWVRVRWGRIPVAIGNNEFFFARRRSEAWGKYVEEFGFRSMCPVAPNRWWNTNSVAAELVLSAWRPFEMFNFSQENQAQWGVPRDAGGPELLAWRRQFAGEFFERLLSAPNDREVSAPSRDFFYGALAMNRSDFVVRDARQRKHILETIWPRFLAQQRASPATFDNAYRRGLRLHFEELGQRDGDKAWLAQLDEIAKNQAEKLRTRPVQLPRASTLDGKTPQSGYKP